MIKDELDWKILEILQDNARLTYAEIGRRVGLSPSATAERVQRMEDEGIIKKYSAELDYKKAGYSLSAYINISFKDDDFKLFLKSIDDFPEIINCSRVTGKDCLVMKSVLKDSAHLENLVDRLIKFGAPSTSVVLSDVVLNGNIVKPE